MSVLSRVEKFEIISIWFSDGLELLTAWLLLLLLTTSVLASNVLKVKSS
jgi:hypothetical protein